MSQIRRLFWPKKLHRSNNANLRPACSLLIIQHRLKAQVELPHGSEARQDLSMLHQLQFSLLQLHRRDN